MNKFRFEDKMFVFLREKNYILSQIMGNFTLRSKEAYEVSSLYYDEKEFNAYFDKKEGENKKKKFRQRFYDNSKNGHYEIKEKIGPRVNKIKSYSISLFPNYIEPALWISYDRLAYNFRNEMADLRVTIDSRVKCGINRKHLFKDIDTQVYMFTLNYKD